MRERLEISAAFKFMDVYNDNSATSGISLIFKVGTGVNIVTVAEGGIHLIYSDGLNNVYQCS